MKSFLRRVFRYPEPREQARSGRRRAQISGRRTIYAIGDVHGCHGPLLALEKRIRADIDASRAEEPLIVYLGDYVDRGPESPAVLDHLSKSGHADGIERIALCGNHDDTFLRFLRNPRENMAWLDFGGDATLRSYGVNPNMLYGRNPDFDALGHLLEKAVPEAHVRLLEDLPCCLSHGERFFVHAGIRPGVALEEQQEADLLWIREPFLSQGPDLPVLVIHGHTAGMEPVFGKSRICIDTACYATGRLTALKVTSDTVSLL